MRSIIPSCFTLSVGALSAIGCGAISSTVDEGPATERSLEPIVPTASSSACMPAACTPVVSTDASITDFEDLGPDGLFVDNDRHSDPGSQWWLRFYGTPYVFPKSREGANTGLTQTMDSAWRVRGTVSDWSGFGLWFNCSVDMSASRGISFALHGDAGTSRELRLFAHTSRNSVPDRCRPNVGTCDATAGACESSFARVPVSSTPGARVELLWEQFTGGHPHPGVDATQILQFMGLFTWYDWAGKKDKPYLVDITLDDFRLLE